MPRRWPTWLLLGLGLLSLFWGLYRLERIFVDEREEAHARVIEEQGTLAEYARRTLEQRLESALHEAEESVPAARSDPLLAAQGLLLVEDGRQLLPRRDTPREGDDAPAQAVYAELRGGTLPAAADPTSPWAERLRMFALLRRMLELGDRGGIEETVNEILRHRGYYVIEGDHDIPYMLALIEEIAARFELAEGLGLTILRDGVAFENGPRTDGLQKDLLRQRARLSARDFQFLGERVAALSRRFKVPTDDFVARRDAAPGALVPVPSPMTEPALLLGGTWYAAPRPAGRVVGLRVDLWALAQETEAEMHGRALLGGQDRLLLPPLTGVVDIASVPLLVESPRFAVSHKAAEGRFWLKTTFAGASAAIALLLGAMALVLQNRKQRFVELKSDFVATVSHELRTPLASIRLMAETLQRRTRGRPEVKDYPERIIKDIDELTFLVENILSFNRLDKGRWKPRPSDVHLADLVDEVAGELPWYGFSDVRVSTRGIDGVVLRADRELLKLLVRNLAKNACTYNERTPVELEVAAVEAGAGRFALEVRDNGVGIAAAERRRVFEDFARGSGGSARGSGLGLSICRRTMRAHGGTISIARSGPEGTSFRLEFPATMVVQQP
jgi:two-component system sensor histidine kinase SenX3